MTGRQAIAKSNADFYNLALIDIRLPDMEGTRLLTTMGDAVPRTAKTIVTGYPSIENAKEAVNKGRRLRCETHPQPSGVSQYSQRAF